MKDYKGLIPSSGHWYSESDYLGLPGVTVSQVQMAIFKKIWSDSECHYIPKVGNLGKSKEKAYQSCRNPRMRQQFAHSLYSGALKAA